MYPRNLSIAPYRHGGFHVTALISADMGETYEPIAHPAVFRDAVRAQAFAGYLRGKQIDLDRWIIATADQITYYVRRSPGEENPAFYSPVSRS